MPRLVVAGFDGSAESMAAALWAGREAWLRGAPLRLVHAWPGRPHPDVSQEKEHAWHHWAERALHTARSELRARHPELRVGADDVAGSPLAVLRAEAEQAQMLVLGSRRVGPAAGYFLGDVSLHLAAGAAAPVVLVRAEPDAMAGEQAGEGHVVVGLGLRRPAGNVLSFAFDAAARRGAPLYAVHVGRVPPVWRNAPWIVDESLRDAREEDDRALETVLAPWQAGFPEVAVHEEIASDSPSRRLVNLASGASLLVIGRGMGPSGPAPVLGPVGHAVVHHALCPVAVVPHTWPPDEAAHNERGETS